MLSIVCWRWSSPKGYRSTFGPQTVNALHRMVTRHYARPHRFLCVTDDPAGIDPGIEIVPDWKDFASVPSPHGVNNPSCYRRLRAFAPDIARVFGERFVSLDLDTVLVGDCVPLWDRPEDFVIWGDTNPRTAYNGSMLLLSAGARPTVWNTFDPKTSPAKASAKGNFGSDQGWISYCLGPREARWTHADGVYSYRNDIQKHQGRLPANARAVFFHGKTDPWSPEGQAIPWVRDAWREAA